MESNTFTILVIVFNLMLGLIAFLFKMALDAIHSKINQLESSHDKIETRLSVSENTYAAQSVKIDGIYTLLERIYKSIDRLTDKLDKEK